MPVGPQVGPITPGLSEGFYVRLFDDLTTALSAGAVAASSTVTQILAATTGISGEKDRY